MALTAPMVTSSSERFLGFRALGSLFFLYTLAHFPLLAFGDARFWDDWSLFKGEGAVTLSIFQQAGVPWVGHFHLLVMQVGWWLYPVLTFLCFFWVVVCLSKISLKLGAGEQGAFWIAAFGAVVPLNFARVAAINASSAMLLTAFMSAWWLLVCVRGRWHFFLRWVALLVFLFSFQMGSLLVMFMAPLTSHFFLRWREVGPIKTWSAAVREVFLSLDLLVLPLLFWWLRNSYLKPSGLFANYNSPAISVAAIWHLFEPLGDFLEGAWLVDGAGLGLILAGAVLLLIRAGAVLLPQQKDETLSRSIVFCLIGLFAYFLATYPYVAVGKLPSYTVWTMTRLQITAQLALPVLLYGMVSFISARIGCRNGRTYVSMLVLGVFVCNWWAVYAEFYVDHLRQVALIQQFKEVPELHGRNAILIDRTKMRAFDTAPGFTEYAALRAEGGANHDVLTLDYATLQSSSWTAFFHLYGKYLGAWSKTEHADPLRDPELYVINPVKGINSKLGFAAKMWTLHIFSPTREQREVATLLRMDGPYRETGRVKGLEMPNASQ